MIFFSNGIRNESLVAKARYNSFSICYSTQLLCIHAVDLPKTVKIAKKIQFNNNIQVKRRCTSEKKPDTESFNLSKFNAAFAFVADSEYGS